MASASESSNNSSNFFPFCSYNSVESNFMIFSICKWYFIIDLVKCQHSVLQVLKTTGCVLSADRDINRGRIDFVLLSEKQEDKGMLHAKFTGFSNLPGLSCYRLDLWVVVVLKKINLLQSSLVLLTSTLFD